MKKLLPFLLLLAACGRCRSDHTNELRENFDATVILMNNTNKIVLFKIVGEDSCFELNATKKGDVINDEWFYNHKVGDVAHFEKLRRDRLFVVDNVKAPVKDTETILTREQRLFPDTGALIKE